MPSSSSGKRSMKATTASRFEGASASQKVRSAEWSGELGWNSQNHATRGSCSTSWTSQTSYEEPWFEKTDDGWWYCNLCGAGADDAHVASSKHQKRAANPEYYGFPREAASGAAHPQQVSLMSEEAVPEPLFPYIAYVTEDGSLAGARWPKCLLCDKWCQDDTSHAGTNQAPAGSKEHAKNLRNCWPGDPWYEENVTKVRLKWHPPSSVQTSDQTEIPPVSQSIDASVEISTPDIEKDPWIEFRQGCDFCLACNKFATDGHVQSEMHLRRVQYWGEENGPWEPWIELRNGDRYCLACNKWATPEHVSNDNHVWRTKLWYQSDETLPGPWIVKRDGENYCLACNKWATQEHLSNDRHLWRAQLWAAGRGIIAEPPDVVAAAVKEVPLRRQRRSNTGSDVYLLEIIDGTDMQPRQIPKHIFASWPLKPRIKDVLLIPSSMADQEDKSNVQPCLKSILPLTAAEQESFAKGLVSRFQQACAETCSTMVAEYYQYMKFVVERAESPEVVGALLSVLQSALALAVSDGNDKSAVGAFLMDTVRSALLGSITPDLVCSGRLDARLGEMIELSDQLATFLPRSLHRLKVLLLASYQRRAELVPAQAKSTAELEDEENLPDHWSTSSFPKQGWAAVALNEELEQDGVVLKALTASLCTDPDELRNLSMIDGMCHSKLILKQAWRIENPELWKDYSMERQRMLSQRYELEVKSLEHASLRQPRMTMPQLHLRAEVSDIFEDLPEQSWREINEVRLLHGVKPENILSLAKEGLHAHICAGQFGKGPHFSEDAGNCDRIVTCDASGGRKEFKDLHSRLYGKSVRHPGCIYYVLVCRVVMGFFVRANRGDADTEDLDTNSQVYSTMDRHELADIPTLDTPYQSLVVEVGEQIRRYREFVQFHHSRIYPEYLLAYQRE